LYLHQVQAEHTEIVEKNKVHGENKKENSMLTVCVVVKDSEAHEICHFHHEPTRLSHHPRWAIQVRITLFKNNPKANENSMKTYRKELWFNLPTRRGFVNITAQVEEALRESGIREGLALVNAMHITASGL
jgi:hypothetical protein